MSVATLLVDDIGAVWPATPAILGGRFSVRHGEDWRRAAVDLGMILVMPSAGGFRIAFRSELVTGWSISRLAALIAGPDPVRIALSSDGRMHSWQLVFGAGPAIARIDQLVAEARNPSPRPLLNARRLPLDQCIQIAGGRLLPVLELRQQTRGRWAAEVYGRLFEWDLLPLTVITRRARASERLLIDHWGEKLRMYGKEWPRIARGRDFEAQPNAEVGRWRVPLQHQTIEEGMPVLTATDHVFRRVSGELARLTSHRAHLPWWTEDGGAVVTAINISRRMLVLERSEPNPASALPRSG